jgi:hypothetical protein
VKLDVDTLATMPDAPPEAGPDRALDPSLAVFAVPAGVEPLLAVALKMPYAPPPTAMAATPTAMVLVSLRENTRRSFPGSLFRGISVDLTMPGHGENCLRWT